MSRPTPPPTPPGGWPGTTPWNTLDTTSSASRQHYIDTGTYLTQAQVAEAAGTPIPVPTPPATPPARERRTPSLTDADRELLDFLGTLSDLTAAAAEPVLFARYGNTTRVWQRVNALLDFEPALAYAPVVVGRLTRLREQRRRVMRRPNRAAGYPGDGHQ